MIMKRERKRVFNLRDGTTVTYERKGDVQNRTIIDPDGGEYRSVAFLAVVPFSIFLENYQRAKAIKLP